MLRTSSNRKYPVRLYFLFLAIACVLLELSVLYGTRSVMPTGIAPAIHTDRRLPVLSGYPETNPYYYDEEIIGAVREVLDEDVGDLSGLTQYEIVTVLRDWTRMLQGPDPSNRFESKDPCEILDSLKSGKRAYCTLFSILYISALNSYGIPARMVALMASPGSFDRAHTTVEVWIGGRWVIQDPTFNSVVTDVHGNLLGVADAMNIYEEGGAVSWVQDATSVTPTMEDYVVPVEELFNLAVYRLYAYDPDGSRIELSARRFIDRLAGRIQGVVLRYDGWMLPDFVMNGRADRILIIIFLVSLAVASIPRRTRKKAA